MNKVRISVEIKKYEKSQTETIKLKKISVELKIAGYEGESGRLDQVEQSLIEFEDRA